MSLIAIVEDELIIARDIKEILEEEGHSCIENITSYQKAIDVIENQNPDLVLIDVILNGVYEGINIGKYLYDKKTIPYIFITSLHDKNTVLEIKQTYPHGYIVKPFKPIDVTTTVELALYNFKHLALDTNRMTVPEITDDTPFQIRKAVRYINEHIYEKIQVDDLVFLTRWKKNHFTTMFTHYMKVSPHQYILQCKIEKCMAMISTTDLSINDIAFELGFNSYSSFSKVFKKIAGITAEEFKRKERLIKTLGES